MEQTFLFADLAGFTALTEEHGDEYGADLAHAFCRALNERLPDGAEDFKMLGDSCLVRVARAEDALLLALRLVEELGGRRSFPPVRIGMHTGTAVQRGSDWFGTTVNTAARIAELAGGNEIVISQATRSAAPRSKGIEFTDLGEHGLRNLSRAHRLFRIARHSSP
jgi:adenylate cyclase